MKRYTPKSLLSRCKVKCKDDYIMTKEWKNEIYSILCKREITKNILLFSEGPGLGKSSVIDWARELYKNNEISFFEVSAEEDPSLNTLIDAQIWILGGGLPIGPSDIIVGIDELGELNATGRKRLKRFLEKVDGVASVIMTTNTIADLSEPFKDRCFIVYFETIFEDNKEIMQTQIENKLSNQMKTEAIEFDMSKLIGIVKTNYPSIRKIIKMTEATFY